MMAGGNLQGIETLVCTDSPLWRWQIPQFILFQHVEALYLGSGFGADSGWSCDIDQPAAGPDPLYMPVLKQYIGKMLLCGGQVNRNHEALVISQRCTETLEKMHEALLRCTRRTKRHYRYIG